MTLTMPDIAYRTEATFHAVYILAEVLFIANVTAGLFTYWATGHINTPMFTHSS